jgi:hypothetical protein
MQPNECPKSKTGEHEPDYKLQLGSETIGGVMCDFFRCLKCKRTIFFVGDDERSEWVAYTEESARAYTEGTREAAT